MYAVSVEQCNGNAFPLEKDSQHKAASLFQNLKRRMKANNDTPDDAPHLTKIGVTDVEGNLMEQYSHKCCCSRY